MINKVELGSVNKRKLITPYSANKVQYGQPSFTGLVDGALAAIQLCEKHPMLNVTALDLTTAIIPRTIFETIIGSKQKDENGKEVEGRHFNFLGGFEALRRESSGLLINCLIPGFIVTGVAKLLNRPIMGKFNSNLSSSWANSEVIDSLKGYYQKTEGSSKDKIYRTLKSMFTDLEGVDGDISKGGLKKFEEVFANDTEFEKLLKEAAEDISNPDKKGDFGAKLYDYMVKKSGVAENVRFKGQKGFSSSSLSHICSSATDLLHDIAKQGDVLNNTESLNKYFSKAKKLVNAKSLAGLGIIIPLAISAQPINRWLTHKISGKKGAPIYNDDEERVLSPSEKAKLTAEKCVAVPLMAGVAALSMLLDRPSLKLFQFKGLFPTMDQARIISAATFSSRIAAAEDTNELKENTIRDIATFSSFYFLGDYAAKAIATLLEKTNSHGIILLNRIKPLDKDANIFKKLWHWAKNTKIKSTDELMAIADAGKRTKAKNLRALCQLGNTLFSLLSLGVFIPLYTRTQTNKKKQREMEKLAQVQYPAESYTQSLIKEKAPAFSAFFK